ncbi:50S ribosomal protein L11 methyltransferase [Geofilum rhodophaeum]|uniref:50S ribosomal protein L11 methyltransferase n=1 Tax=Geofilum rhodophaeum TaxID=1965019 RepID=UPI000B524923|nr:50S ribosomal protein L11 methyltransferase [Geofilum rhodophaeum]
MNYIQVKAIITPYSEDRADVLMALMGPLGFESFENTDGGLLAYIPEADFTAEKLTGLELPWDDTRLAFSHELIPDQNWNEEWEKHYFQPIVVENKCVVRSPFHAAQPEIPLEIIIAPKMSFGTGHHETTSMVMALLLQMEVEGKTVLDMGCGTGILGILASKLGAVEVTGIDIDSWCTTNSAENCELNAVSNMQLKLGDASLLQKEGQFDLILANINKNILLADLPQYVKNLRPGATLIMSGFYQHDLKDIDALAQKHKLRLKKTLENNQWTAVAYVLEAAI